MSAPDVVLDLYPGLVPAGGIGRYVRDVAAALRDRPDAPPHRFAVPRELRDVARARYRAEECLELPFDSRVMRLAGVVSAQLGIAFDAWFGSPAVFHAPMGAGPLMSGARTIASVHDLTFLQHPEWHPARTVFLLQRTVPVVARRATRVLCHSDWVRREVQAAFDIPEERFVVIPPPVGQNHDDAVGVEARPSGRVRHEQ